MSSPIVCAIAHESLDFYRTFDPDIKIVKDLKNCLIVELSYWVWEAYQAYVRQAATGYADLSFTEYLLKMSPKNGK